MALVTTRRTMVRATLACAFMGLAVMQAAGCDVELSTKASETVTVSIADPANKIRLQNMVGDVIVRADASATAVTAEAVKIGKGVDDGAAKAALAEISVSVGPSADESGLIVLEAKHPSGKMGHGYEVKWTVTAPPGVVVDIAGNVGDISVYGFSAGGTIKSNVGDIDVKDVGGGVTITSNVGDVKANGITGGATITTSTGDIEVQGAGLFSAKTSTGDVEVRVSGSEIADLRASTSTGDVDVTLPTTWKGKIKASSSVGDIEIRAAGFARGDGTSRKSVSGTINGGGDASIEVTCRVGDVTIENGKSGG